MIHRVIAADGLPAVNIIEPAVFKDPRGFFIQTYSSADFHEVGITCTFVQDNHSFSQKGVLRGLHYQLGAGQAKLITVIRGRILDVAVDIRRGSPTFGKYVQVELSAEDHRMLFLPVGFAHGFYALEDTDVIYKCSDIYRPDQERGIVYDDPDIGIPWPAANPQVSDRDLAHPRLADLPRQDLFVHEG